MPQPTNSPPWAVQLLTGCPVDGRRHHYAAEITSRDSSIAQDLATKTPALVDALADLNQLETVPGDDLRELLRTVDLLRRQLTAATAAIVTTWHGRDLDRGSFRDIGAVLGLHHTSVADRYQQLQQISRGINLVPHDPPIRITPDPQGWTLTLDGTSPGLNRGIKWGSRFPLVEVLLDSARYVADTIGQHVITWQPHPPPATTPDQRPTYEALFQPRKKAG